MCASEDFDQSNEVNLNLHTYSKASKLFIRMCNRPQSNQPCWGNVVFIGAVRKADKNLLIVSHRHGALCSEDLFVRSDKKETEETTRLSSQMEAGARSGIRKTWAMKASKDILVGQMVPDYHRYDVHKFTAKPTGQNIELQPFRCRQVQPKWPDPDTRKHEFEECNCAFLMQQLEHENKVHLPEDP